MLRHAGMLLEARCRKVDASLGKGKPDGYRSPPVSRLARGAYFQGPFAELTCGLGRGTEEP
jgi:hypothetical protein